MTAPVAVTWRQALAWRMRRHLLEPVAAVSVDEVVRRLCGVQAQVPSAAELAIRLRQASSEAGEVGGALAEGRLVRTWAMRGTLHLLAAGDAGSFLSLLAAGRTWERPSWIRYFKVRPEDWPPLRAAVREALDGRVLTREELVAAILAQPAFAHLGDELRSGWGTLFKPLAWQGDLVFGPSRGNRTTFTSPWTASDAWRGVPSVEEAAPAAISAYLGAYAPATVEHFAAWLSRGWMGKRLLKAWFAELGDRLATVDLEGEAAFVRAEDVDELAATRPSSTVRLLGGFDQWVLGPGTDDVHVIPPGRRSAVSRTAGWIAPVVVAGGVVSGTWEMDGELVRVGWFAEFGKAPKRAIEAEVARLGAILGRELRARVSAA
ncbi:MAG TPA: crosslink repair DNA glycosylase YcaQ family protein [Candidatus Limnocylindrales bacterium]